MAIVLDGTTGITAPDVDSKVNGLNYPDASSMGFRNRIINGDMRIDQRNAGAQITIPNASSAFPVDRFQVFKDTSSGVFYGQQSTTAPASFANSLLLTANTAWTPATGDLAVTQQKIEAFNTSDLAFGSASAASVTLSFWVRSSITGTYCAALINSANNRSYVATYTINAANTFEYKTITISGDIAGTWISNTNGVGIRVNFDLGSGSTYNTTAGSWVAGLFTRTSGSVNWTQTSGATFYITGVQLEAGSVATPFERRPFGTELALCQRYFELYQTTAASTSVVVGQAISGAGTINTFTFKTQKRAAPTFSSSGTWIALNSGAGNAGGAISMNSANEYTARLDISGASGLSAGNASILFCNTSGGTLQFSAEL